MCGSAEAARAAASRPTGKLGWGGGVSAKGFGFIEIRRASSALGPALEQMRERESI